MTLIKFLQNHLIRCNLLPHDKALLKLQNALTAGKGVDEIIVDKPMEFIDAVLQNGYYISCVMWWDRVKMDKSSAIGMGGPRDPRDPDMYYFSEVVYLDKYFDKSTTKEDYCDYIKSIFSAYSSYDLYPGFDIEKK